LKHKPTTFYNEFSLLAFPAGVGLFQHQKVTFSLELRCIYIGVYKIPGRDGCRKIRMNEDEYGYGHGYGDYEIPIALQLM
jgi:hypothetical protein